MERRTRSISVLICVLGSKTTTEGEVLSDGGIHCGQVISLVVVELYLLLAGGVLLLLHLDIMVECILYALLQGPLPRLLSKHRRRCRKQENGYDRKYLFHIFIFLGEFKEDIEVIYYLYQPPAAVHAPCPWL